MYAAPRRTNLGRNWTMLYPQNASEIEIFITTRREGVLTKIGHDLKLRVVPDSFVVEGEQFSGSVRVSEIEILGALVGDDIESMSSGDTAKILKTIQKKVLEAKRYPEVTFSGTYGSSIDVELVIRNKKGSLSLDHADDIWSGVLDHRDFGIAQVKALLGALKVNPLIEIGVKLSS